MKALEKNQTGELVDLSRGNMTVGVSGYLL